MDDEIELLLAERAIARVLYTRGEQLRRGIHRGVRGPDDIVSHILD